MKYVIFSIDEQDDDDEVAWFITWFRQVSTQGNLVPMLGCYEGSEERSFMCLYSSFNRHVRGSAWIEWQESILLVSECNKMYARLEYLDGRDDVGLGSMHEVSEEEAKASDNWTYSPSRKIYWVAKKGNPDRVHGDPLENEPQDKRNFLYDWWFELLFFVLLLILSLFITPVEAQAVPQDPPQAVGYHMLEDQDDRAVMAVYLLNRVDFNVSGAVTLSTPYGPVMLWHEITKNDQCGLGVTCPDRLDLIDWPGGICADAMSITVQERSAGAIRFYDCVGV